MRQSLGVRVDVAVLPTMVRIFEGGGVFEQGVCVGDGREMEVMMMWGIL